VHNNTGAEAVVNDNINNYAQRMSGWFIPPADGAYVFFLSSDDDSDLFLSTDATAASKTLIAQENAWSGTRSWTNSGGGSILSQKRSDQWTNDTGTAPFSSGINLLGGHAYYIEAVSHQGGGGDDLGILAQVAGSPDPTNGAPPIPAGQLSLLSSPTTTLTWKTQPHDTTVFEGGTPLFTSSATSDSEFAVMYQWQRDGTNMPGVTGANLPGFTATLPDNGTKFAVIASTAEGGLSITSTVATLTVQAAVFEPGLALMKYWVNKTDHVPGEQGLFGDPDFVMAVPAFEEGVNNENGDSFVVQLTGFFVPATSGAYDFITTGDDFNDFFISTDESPNNKRIVCQQVGWSNALTWGTDNGGGADLNQKHSATWTNAAGTALFANGIQLTAGTKYWIEDWMHEGTGGDSVAVYVKKHGDPDPADGTDGNITGSTLGFKAPAATFANFTQQPTNESVLSGNTATFTATGVSDGNIPIGTTGQFQTGTAPGDKKFLSFPNILIQWYRNGSIIAGATTTSYTTAPLKPTDGAQFTAQIRALGLQNWATSSVATLTIITDTNKPTVYSAVFDEQGLPVISVSFSKTMDLSTITNPANYSVSGGGANITGILVDTNDLRHIQLQLGAEPTGPITLTLTGITDFSGNPPTTTTLNVATSPLINADIGDGLATAGQAGFIGFPGAMYSDAQGSFTVTCEGSDIWDVEDGFNFSYETKTNDFDVVVRQISFTKVSNWSKGGLMAREDLAAGSRDWNVVNDPTSADGKNAVDGSGTGANTVESNTRSTNGLASLGWGVAPGTIPNYPNAWVRLKRTGQILQSYWSSNGVEWARQGLADVSTNANGPLPAVMYVGICCTAHANDNFNVTALRFVYTGSFANYNSSFVAAPPQARLTASLSGGNVVISWSPTGGTLQSSPTLGATATWTPVGTANPSAPIPATGGAKFFRVGP
jgi:hypothetical protein